MTTKELLDGWEHLIADDLRSLGSRNMTESPVLGIVRAFLAMEVRFGIAPAALRRRS